MPDGHGHGSRVASNSSSGPGRARRRSRARALAATRPARHRHRSEQNRRGRPRPGRTAVTAPQAGHTTSRVPQQGHRGLSTPPIFALPGRTRETQPRSDGHGYRSCPPRPERVPPRPGAPELAAPVEPEGRGVEVEPVEGVEGSRGRGGHVVALSGSVRPLAGSGSVCAGPGVVRRSWAVLAVAGSLRGGWVPWAGRARLGVWPGRAA